MGSDLFLSPMSRSRDAIMKKSFLLRYAEFVRDKYPVIVVLALIIGIATGLVSSGPGRFLQQYSILFIIIMIGAMGFAITIKSLGAAVANWRGVSLGLVMNFLFAPFLCWLLAVVLLSGQPGFAVGLILIGVVPCAGMAMVWAGLLEGDVPLATVINAVTMIAAPFIIPFIMLLFAGRFVAIDTQGMFVQVLLSVLLPLCAGLLLREILERRSPPGMQTRAAAGAQGSPGTASPVKRLLPLMPAISATMAVLLMFMAVNTGTPLVQKNVSSIAPLIVSILLIFPALFVVAYIISRQFFTPGQNIAITYSTGMKNLPIAIGIAAVSFGEMEMLPVAIAFAFQMLTAVVFYQVFRRCLSATGV